jgi:hypothetical protein
MTHDLTMVCGLQAFCADMEADMVEKGLASPRVDVWVSDRFTVHLDWSPVTPIDGKSFKFFSGSPIFAVVKAAQDWVDALPSPEEAGIRRYMEQVAKTIEVGREENIPDQYVVPFREVQKAMTDNLLPAPKAGVA